MRNLSLTILACMFVLHLASQSPHGNDFDTSCDDCHTTEGWKINPDSIRFSHNSTEFPLQGQHQVINCRMCHPTLVFSEAEPSCVSCHTDMHNQTVGMECERCHTPQSWLVNNITEIHQLSRFPLLGPHLTADCQDCHPSASLLQFEPLGVECYDCHRADYMATTNPNHVLSGFSTNCTECHLMNAFFWTGPSFNHDFFPLTQGHEGLNCNVCHEGGNYSGTSPECFSCHQTDYESAENPNHAIAEFSTNCLECHTTSPGWRPADFREHDGLYFPIYSGKHQGEWGNCMECHTDQSNYTLFSCIDCHEHNQPDTDEEHDDVNGYIYQSQACLDCHPTGDAEEGFDHNLTAFPLTGAHVETTCIECHAEGYSGTTMYCGDCHQTAYQETSNPNHTAISIPDDCGQCHTTMPGWIPATFPIHGDYYPLTGAHAEINTDCATCHGGDYVNTPAECFGCHEPDFNQSANPSHTGIGIPNTCEQCHSTQPGWQPALFPIHDDYYALTGAHLSISTDCFACHENDYIDTPNECFGCHESNYNQTSNPDHTVAGIPNDCEQCHTTQPGWEPALFPVHDEYYPLTGAHSLSNTDCFDCHEGNYANTPNQCFGCHEPDYNSAANPSHTSINLATECDLCHTTNHDWQPALFPVHDEFYVLQGAHNLIASDCFACHGGNYNNTPNTCFGCHDDDYNQTNDPPHASAQFPTDCELCHNQTAWEPSSFDHDNQYFPIYSGRHEGEWDQCADCHTNAGNYSVFSCIDCHEHNQPDMDEEHEGVPGYVYNSIACLDCHPNGEAMPSAIRKIR